MLMGIRAASEKEKERKQYQVRACVRVTDLTIRGVARESNMGDGSSKKSEVWWGNRERERETETE